MQLLDAMITERSNIDQVAVVYDDTSITYKDLYESSLNVSWNLMLEGISVGDGIIIYMETSVNFVISIFGVLRSGAAYIPIDCSMPMDRFLYIVNNSCPKVIITDDSYESTIRSFVSNNLLSCSVLNIASIIGEGREPVDRAFVTNRTSLRSGKDLAYIIYTSGSTGDAKGVMIRHESVLAYVSSYNSLSGYNSTTRYLNVCPFFYDASVISIFCTLAAGGELYLINKFRFPSEITKAMDRYKITDMAMVSSVLKLLVSRFSNIKKYNFTDLRTICFGAEVCSVEALKELKKLVPQLRFLNGYGPTEATCGVIYYVFDDIDEKLGMSIPMGKPFPTVYAYALNEAQEMIKPGEIGELLLGGVQIMEGYCKDPERTSMAFTKDIFGLSDVMYKTGDYVTIDAGGNYTFIGRLDDMVKIGGNRVYLSEIEKVILSSGWVKEAILLVGEDDFFNANINAYIVLNDTVTISHKELADFISTKLPSYMLPTNTVFITEDNMPITSSGKIDRNALLKLKPVAQC